MELTEQERELEKSTAESHGSLSIGLFATALLVRNTVDGVGWISIAVLGALFVLSSIYLAFVHKWKRKEFLGIAAKVQIKHVAWFLGFTALGISLIRTEVNCLAIPGIICIGLGYAILFFGSLRVGKGMATKARGTQEVKEQGRSNTNAMDRKELIELYKITLEEMHRREWLYVQAIVGTVILIPAFLMAIGFIFGSGSPVYLEHVPWVKGIIFGLAILLAGFLGLTIYQVNKSFEACDDVAQGIESKLRNVRTPEETSEFDGFLVRKVLREIEFNERFGRIRFRFYVPILVVVFIALGLVLFVLID